MKFCPLCYGQVSQSSEYNEPIKYICIRCFSSFDAIGTCIAHNNKHISEAVAAMEFKPAVNDAPVYDVKASKVIAKPETEPSLPTMPSAEYTDTGFELVPIGTINLLKHYKAAYQGHFMFSNNPIFAKLYDEIKDKLFNLADKLNYTKQ